MIAESWRCMVTVYLIHHAVSELAARWLTLRTTYLDVQMGPNLLDRSAPVSSETHSNHSHLKPSKQEVDRKSASHSGRSPFAGRVLARSGGRADRTDRWSCRVAFTPPRKANTVSTAAPVRSARAGLHRAHVFGFCSTRGPFFAST